MSPMTESTLLLEAVSEVARRAGNVALQYFGKEFVIETKANGSPVTIADRSAEVAAREWIASRFPKDGIVGEELDPVNQEARRRWLIDPIDGTKTFVRGVPLWGTLVALCEGRGVIAGAAYFPALDEMMSAAVGAGCWWNGRRANVSTVDSIGQSTVLTTDERFTAMPARRESWDRLAAASAVSRSWGDCYGYLLVATGRAEVMVDAVVAEWDTAAVQRCVVEAGGVFTSWEGEATPFGKSGIATNLGVAAEARRLLGGET
jgi:histidinol-phosphatase